MIPDIHRRVTQLFVFCSIQINEVKRIMGPIVDKLPVLCSDPYISRYLRARNWNTKKASKMLKDSLKWRLEYKPERLRWVRILKLLCFVINKKFEGY